MPFGCHRDRCIIVPHVHAGNVHDIGERRRAIGAGAIDDVEDPVARIDNTIPVIQEQFDDGAIRLRIASRIDCIRSLSAENQKI